MEKETLEEAAERILYDNTGMLTENHPSITESMIDLAEWQAERMYTEEDVKRAIYFGQGMELWKEEEQVDKFIQSLNQSKQQK